MQESSENVLVHMHGSTGIAEELEKEPSSQVRKSVPSAGRSPGGWGGRAAARSVARCFSPLDRSSCRRHANEPPARLLHIKWSFLARVGGWERKVEKTDNAEEIPHKDTRLGLGKTFEICARPAELLL